MFVPVISFENGEWVHDMAKWEKRTRQLPARRPQQEAVDEIEREVDAAAAAAREQAAGDQAPPAPQAPPQRAPPLPRAMPEYMVTMMMNSGSFRRLWWA